MLLARRGCRHAGKHRAIGRRAHNQPRTTSKISIEPPIERSTYVEAKASQILQLGIAESWLRTFDKATLGVGAVFIQGVTIGCEMDPHFKDALVGEMNHHFREAWNWKNVKSPPTRHSLR